MLRANTPVPSRTPAPAPRAWVFIGRALRLRCPECGVSPVFIPLKRVRGIDDWLRPLDGCPRCGYAYEREQGYWLLAIWGVNYGLVAALGCAAAMLMLELWHPPIWKIMAFLFVPMPLLSFLFARHAKTLFLAMDHYFDPHLK